MNSSELRAEARNKLNGKWGKVACITLVYCIFAFILNFVENILSDSISGLFSLFVSIIELPISFGLIISFLKVYKDEDVGCFDFFTLGFSNFKKAWGVALRTFLKMLAPMILLIISIFIIAGASAMLTVSAFSASSTLSDSSGAFSIVLFVVAFILLIASSIWATMKSYYYQLAILVSIDNPEMTSKEAVEHSAKLMNGNRWKFFCLQMSFIGWMLLACFTFGIGLLWLLPYIQFAIIAFYEFRKNNCSDVKASDSTINE